MVDERLWLPISELPLPSMTGNIKTGRGPKRAGEVWKARVNEGSICLSDFKFSLLSSKEKGKEALYASRFLLIFKRFAFRLLMLMGNPFVIWLGATAQLHQACQLIGCESRSIKIIKPVLIVPDTIRPELVDGWEHLKLAEDGPVLQ